MSDDDLRALDATVVEAARRFLRETVRRAWGYPGEELIALDDALLARDAAITRKAPP